jgi:hypothetical protein
MKAFILGVLSTRVGLEDCINAIRKQQMEKLKRGETYLLYGHFDIISKFEGEREDLELLLEIMASNGVADTNTMIVDELGLNYEVEGCDSIRKAAYVFLKSSRPTNFLLWESALKQIKDVVEFHEIYGFHDVVVSVREEARHNFLNKVSKPLWAIAQFGLTITQTMFTIEI